MLWTRRPYPAGTQRAELFVEVAADDRFDTVIASAPAPVSPESDWTCRVLVAGLKPLTVYWYRFVDGQGNGSRIGRTITAPADRDSRPVKFAFVSCQNVNEGAQNAYRRMLYEDRRAADGEQLGFVLHLGDFIYEVVSDPGKTKTRYDRIIYDIGRIPDGRNDHEGGQAERVDGERDDRPTLAARPFGRAQVPVMVVVVVVAVAVVVVVVVEIVVVAVVDVNPAGRLERRDADRQEEEGRPEGERGSREGGAHRRAGSTTPGPAS